MHDSWLHRRFIMVCHGALPRIASLCVIVLAACTLQAQVPAIEGADIGAAGGRQSGKFAAMVQDNEWDMKFSFKGLACAPFSFEADAKPAWHDAMRSALVAALGEVDFVATLKPPASLPVPYDAQIGVVQADGSTHVEIAPKGLGLLGFNATAETHLRGDLTVVFPNGTFDYEPIEGTGTGTSTGHFCGDVRPAIRQATAAALSEIVRQAITKAKLRLASTIPAENGGLIW
jgi:hypothetical protein